MSYHKVAALAVKTLTAGFSQLADTSFSITLAGAVSGNQSLRASRDITRPNQIVCIILGQ